MHYQRDNLVHPSVHRRELIVSRLKGPTLTVQSYASRCVKKVSDGDVWLANVELCGGAGEVRSHFVAQATPAGGGLYVITLAAPALVDVVSDGNGTVRISVRLHWSDQEGVDDALETSWSTDGNRWDKYAGIADDALRQSSTFSGVQEEDPGLPPQRCFSPGLLAGTGSPITISAAACGLRASTADTCRELVTSDDKLDYLTSPVGRWQNATWLDNSTAPAGFVWHPFCAVERHSHQGHHRPGELSSHRHSRARESWLSCLNERRLLFVGDSTMKVTSVLFPVPCTMYPWRLLLVGDSTMKVHAH